MGGEIDWTVYKKLYDFYIRSSENIEPKCKGTHTSEGERTKRYEKMKGSRSVNNDAERAVRRSGRCNCASFRGQRPRSLQLKQYLRADCPLQSTDSEWVPEEACITSRFASMPATTNAVPTSPMVLRTSECTGAAPCTPSSALSSAW